MVRLNGVFTKRWAGLKNVNRYIGNIVTSKIVVSGFHYTYGYAVLGQRPQVANNK